MLGPPLTAVVPLAANGDDEADDDDTVVDETGIDELRLLLNDEPSLRDSDNADSGRWRLPDAAAV